MKRVIRGLFSRKHYFSCLVLLMLFGCAEKEPRWFKYVRRNDVERVQKAAGQYDITEKNKFGTTALHIAARHGYLEISNLLIKQGADVNSSDNKGIFVLDYAVENGHKRMVELLIESGAFVDIRFYELDPDPLLIAILNKRYEILEVLLLAGFDANFTDSEGRTPLLGAVSFKDSEAVRILLENGASANGIAQDGTRLIEYAVTGQQYDVLELFLKHGYSPPATYESYSDSLLWLAISMNDQTSLQLLIEYLGVDFSYEYKGRSTLDYAVMLDAKASLDLLCQQLESAKNKQKALGKALIVASTLQNLGIIKELVGYGADVDYHYDQNDLSPMAIAIDLKNKDIVKYLLAQGADPEQVVRGVKIIDFAIDSGAEEIVDLLLAELGDRDPS